MMIEWLKNKKKEKFYPVTHADAVLCGDDSDVTLTGKLTYYATTASVESLSAEVDTIAYGEYSGNTNLWDERIEKGIIDANGQNVDSDECIRSIGYIRVKPNTTYCVVSSGSIGIRAYKIDKSFKESIGHIGNNGTFTTSSDVYYIRFFLTKNYGTVYKNDTAIIEGTSGTYEPYIKSNAQLTESANASEVRDAELCVLGWNVPSGMTLKNTVEGGVLTQNVGRVDLGGLRWERMPTSVSGKYRFSASVDGIEKNSMSHAFCSDYNIIVSSYTATDTGYVISESSIFVYDSSKDTMTTEAFGSSVSGTYLYYELATPINHNIVDSLGIHDEFRLRDAELQMLGWCVPSEMPIKNSYVNGVLTQYVGRVDLASITWNKDTVTRPADGATIHAFYGKHNDAKAASNTTIGNIYMQGFTAESSSVVDRGGYYDVMDNLVGVDNASKIWVYKAAYNDMSVSTFTDAVKGKYIYFELATPITHNITDMPSQKSMISDEWDQNDTGQYKVGDLRIDNNRLYRCKIQTDKTSGRPSTDTAHWELTDIAYEIARVENSAMVFPNAGSHNSIYRGKFLGGAVTAAQYSAIAAGTFDDLYVGDYWTIGGVNYRIAHFDYWLHCGDTECTKHHIVVVPDGNLYAAKMNDTNVTTGAYVGSKMYTANLADAKTTIRNAFGTANILTHRELLSNTTSGNRATNWSWYDSDIELMNESMVYGSPVGSKAVDDSINFNVGIDKSQLALFALDPSRITNSANWWLRCVVSSATFAYVSTAGGAGYYDASGALGVRPAFGIC